MSTTERTANVLRLEPLEGRLALSGNVTAEVVNGDLVVRGDDLGNSVVVLQAAGNKFTVEGVNTTVNGKASKRTFTGVTSDMTVSLGDGNDRLSLGRPPCDLGGRVSDDLQIDLGGGRDRVEIGGLFSVFDDATIETGTGSDVVVAYGFNVADDLTVRKSQANAGDFDTVSLNLVYVGTSAGVTGVLTVDLAGGNDVVHLSSLSADQFVVNTRGGRDTVTLQHARWDGTRASVIDAGGGTDLVTLHGNRADRPRQIGTTDVRPTVRGADDISTLERAAPPV